MPKIKDFDLFKEFGIENLPDEKKEAIQEQVLTLIESRFTRSIIERLSEEDKKELDEVISRDSAEEMDKFIVEKVPDFAEIQKNIVEELKKEMLSINSSVSK